MNLKFYLEKLHDSEEYKKFIKVNPSGFLCSGFFSIDKVGEDNKQHFDFYVSSANSSFTAHLSSQIDDDLLISKDSDSSDKLSTKQQKAIDLALKNSKKSRAVKQQGNIFSFQLENNCKIVPIEMFDKKIPGKLSQNLDFDFEDVERLIGDKMVNERVNKKIQKILFSLQQIDGKDFIVSTVFVSGLGMIKVNIDINEKKITEFEKKSFFDMVNVLKKK